jgi:hypothetical protein
MKTKTSKIAFGLIISILAASATIWILNRRSPESAAPPLAEMSTHDHAEHMSAMHTAGTPDEDEETPAYLAESTRKMAERLQQIADAPHPETNIYANEARIAYFKNMKRPPDLLGRLQVDGQLAMEYLFAGHNEDAVQAFTQILQMLEDDDDSAAKKLVTEAKRHLAVSYLRLGEQDNCISQHTAESCLLPIEGTGIHRIRRGAEGAIKLYTELLGADPNDISSRWLFNIAYMTLGQHPDQVPSRWLIPTKVFESDYDIKRFRDVAPRLGVAVNGLSGGSIIEDFDGDGYLDIMASSWGPRDQIRLFRNNREGSFEERAIAAGLKGIVAGLNLCHADYNNDGYPDVLVLRGAWRQWDGLIPNSLLRNNGDGTFDDVTEEAGLLSFNPTQTAAWGDFDNDGWVDLFIGNEIRDLEHRSELFRNNGDGTFTEVSEDVGVIAIGYTKGSAWGDYNNDGLLDLYVSFLMEPNLLFRNDGKNSKGDWTFTEVSVQAGVREPVRSFPTWFWDYDNDGWLDIFVSGFSWELKEVAEDYLGLPNFGERLRLYRNNRDGTFTDVTKGVGLYKVLLTMGCNFGDLDNDGFLDFYAGTGEPTLFSLMPNRMFRNAAGEYFQDVSTSGGFGHLQKGHAISFGDLDNDGDQDIYAVMGGALSGDAFTNVCFENPGHGNHWITLKLEGVRSNRAAIGARIKVTVTTPDGDRDIYATVTTGGSFGASSLQQEIGLGQATSILAIEITWPVTGKTQRFPNITMDQILKIREGEATPIPLAPQRLSFSAPL